MNSISCCSEGGVKLLCQTKYYINKSCRTSLVGLIKPRNVRQGKPVDLLYSEHKMMASSAVKQWGTKPFWGLCADYDPQWILNEEQKEIQRKLIQCCRTVIRPNAVAADEKYLFPRESMNALASLGLLGLIVPKELGGLGQNHVCAAMIVETIARYGCPSTAMVYVMHVAAVATMLFRYHKNKTIQDLLRRLDKEKIIGTLVYSDPATGSHNWFPASSKAKQFEDGNIQVLRYGAWVTSAGFADFYVVDIASPSCDGDVMNISQFLMYKDEVRSSTDDWSALGMHGNQSSPVVCEALLTPDRLIGSLGEFPLVAHEVADPYFLLLSSACWNGVAMGSIDIAKKHVIRTEHIDVGLRVGDYPIIQDYFGKAVTETNCARMMLFSVAQGMDHVTNNNDFSVYEDESAMVPRRGQFHHWCFQVKVKTAANVNNVTDEMLHACGGVGYKRELGLERLLRDGKAGWMMGASNEVLRQVIGKTSLFGLGVIDLWSKIPDKRVLNLELNKLNGNDKRLLAHQLLIEADIEDPTLNHKAKPAYQGTDFENPFNTGPPAVRESFSSPVGTVHHPCLRPELFTPLKLLAVKHLAEMMAEYTFSLPNPTDHTGCLPGQYVKVRVGKCQRFLSPVSRPSQFGQISLLLKYESHGMFSNGIRSLEIGDTADFAGPCGGYEYHPNSVKHLSLLVSGMSCQPAVQLVREVMANPQDQTSIYALLYAPKPADIPYREELEKCSADDSRLKVSFTVGDVDCDDWQGAEGFIDADLLSKVLPPPDVSSHRVLVCGGPRLVVGVLRGLYLLGYESEKIFVYGQFGVQQIKAVYGKFAKLAKHRDATNTK